MAEHKDSEVDTKVTRDVDEDLVMLATEALQAQERISWHIGQYKSNDYASSEKIHKCLDALRSQKSFLEASDADFVGPTVAEESLVELKQLTLMHTPSSVTDAAKEAFVSLVDKCFGGQVKSVESITLLTCPWYEASQRERGEQAKHNILLVVFCFHDKQFFSPANAHFKDNASVTDFGWFSAVESSHVGQALSRGRTRFLEAVFNRPGADISSSCQWLNLKGSLDFMTVTGTPGFLEACLGQAVGGVSKKKKNGGMRLIEGTTIAGICSSFRLLQLAENTLCREANSPKLDVESLSATGRSALAKVKDFYEAEDKVVCKQEMFVILMNWVTELRPLVNAFKAKLGKVKQVETDSVVGRWMMETRLQGRGLNPIKYLSDETTRLQELMQRVGGPVAVMKPEQILLVAVAGSAMYNLNLPSSDVDYVVVYSTPTETLLSATKKLPECHESRGKNKAVEYGAYEARLLCEMLLKCSVVILELLFTDQHEYTSPAWQDLCKHKKRFVTEKAILQYLGLIKNNFKSIEKGRHSDCPSRDRKLFYQNFHKLNSIKALMEGQIPEVRVEGQVRDFIMAVRTQDTGEWSRENILVKLEEEYRDVREKLCSRKQRQRENPDFNLCTDWLMSVRGLT